MSLLTGLLYRFQIRNSSKTLRENDKSTETEEIYRHKDRKTEEEIDIKNTFEDSIPTRTRTHVFVDQFMVPISNPEEQKNKKTEKEERELE